MRVETREAYESISIVNKTGEVLAFVPKEVGNCQEIANSIAKAINLHDELVAAVSAAVAYDTAIRGRGETGEYTQEIDMRAAFVEGEDLDTLYFSWVEKAHEVFKKVKYGETSFEEIADIVENEWETIT